MENQNNQISVEDLVIGFTPDASAMIVTIPLKKWANDMAYGDILVSGSFIKAERMALKNLQLIRDQQKTSNGIITPIKKPLHVA